MSEQGREPTVAELRLLYQYQIKDLQTLVRVQGESLTAVDKELALLGQKVKFYGIMWGGGSAGLVAGAVEVMKAFSG